MLNKFCSKHIRECYVSTRIFCRILNGLGTCRRLELKKRNHTMKLYREQIQISLNAHICGYTFLKGICYFYNPERKKCTLKNIKHNVFGRMEQLFSELTNVVFFSICLLLKMPNFPHPVFERPPGE